MKKRNICVGLLILVVTFLCATKYYISHSHTYTLSSSSAIKDEEIQPLFGSISVTSNIDTSVLFTDIDTGETYTIGYVTHGLRENIDLRANHWYSVEGQGKITITAINVRVK